MSRALAAAALAGLFAVAVGCSSGPKTHEVSGTVKYDGQDVADGEIIFAPENPALGPDAGRIKDGKYTAIVKEGKHKVRITATRAVPGKKGPMGEDWIDQFVPEKYNTQTTLAAEVGSGKTRHDFDMKK